MTDRAKLFLVFNDVQWFRTQTRALGWTRSDKVVYRFTLNEIRARRESLA